MVENEKEEQIFRSRLRELAEKSFQQNLFTFTGFLGLRELSIFQEMEREVSYAGYTLSGGREGAQRQMVRFGDAGALGYETEFPIACVHVRAPAAKFAEPLSHRDFLGALMNLGIDRSVIGDILAGEQEAYLFCQESIAEHICENLSKVRHTAVLCEVVKDCSQVPEEKPEICCVQVASLRIDAVIAKIYNKSRSDCLKLFQTGKVFVNGRLCENNSAALKGKETVNVRGYGKFVLTGEAAATKKGKLQITAEVYR